MTLVRQPCLYYDLVLILLHRLLCLETLPFFPPLPRLRGVGARVWTLFLLLTGRGGMGLDGIMFARHQHAHVILGSQAGARVSEEISRRKLFNRSCAGGVHPDQASENSKPYCYISLLFDPSLFSNFLFVCYQA